MPLGMASECLMARLVSSYTQTVWCILQDDAVLGKLRIRLSTLRPWEEIECTLPMLSDRDKGGTKVGQAHVSLKVRIWLDHLKQCEHRSLDHK